MNHPQGGNIHCIKHELRQLRQFVEYIGTALPFSRAPHIIVTNKYQVKNENEGTVNVIKKSYFLTPFEALAFQDRNPVFRLIDVTDLRYTGA